MPEPASLDGGTAMPTGAPPAPFAAALHGREAERLAALDRFGVLDTPREPAFDDLAALASEICETPIAVVNLIAEGRQWFKAEVGLGVRETPLESSFCAHAILENDWLEVPDAMDDPRFECNPLVTAEGGLRFYAGALLKTADGLPIGTLCVLDTVPKHLSEWQANCLKRLARQAMSQIELSHALKARTQSEAHYRTAIDLNPQTAWTAGPDGQLDTVGARWTEWTGTSGLGSSWGDAMHPDDLGRSVEVWTRSVATGVPYDIEHRARMRDGSFRWMHSRAFPHRDADGRIAKWYGTTEDIHDRKRSAEAIRAHAEELRTVLDAVPAGIWLTRDAQAENITGNARSFEMLRVAQGSNQSKSDPMAATGHFEFLDGRGRVLPPAELPVQRAARGEDVRDYEFRVAFSDGTHIDIFGNAMPFHDGDGRISGAVAAFVDITARKRWEEHQRLLVNELNHRVKNTLATVQSIANQTLRNAKSPDEARHALGARLVALARAHDVLTSENWESADLWELVSQAVAPFSNAREDRLHLKGPSVRVPPRMALALSMALQELGTNAAKYGALSDEAGQIAITWTVDGRAATPRLGLRWEESGGPRVETPARRGFGSRLIERGLAQELDGEAEIRFAPAGVVCAISAPL